MPRLIDAIPYFREADVLALRLETLRDTVDQFVIVEGDRTHAGAVKPFHGFEDRGRFEAIVGAGRILWYPAILPTGEGLPATRRREMGQRNAIAPALTLLGLSDADIVLISDADEIPHPAVLRALRERGLEDGEVAVFRQRLCYYNLNTTAGYVWNGTRAARAADVRAMSPHAVRYGFGLPDAHYPRVLVAQPGGWHLSYFGGVDAVRQKMTSFLHQELVTDANTAPEAIAGAIASGADVWGRGEGGHEFTVGPADDVPPPVAADPLRWRGLFHPDYLPAPTTTAAWAAMDADSGMEAPR